MPQGKQGQTYKELGYETSEKIHQLGKKVSITDRLKPTLFSSNRKTGQYFSDKNIHIQLFHCSSATGSPIVAGSAPTKFFRETPVEMLSLKYKKRGLSQPKKPRNQTYDNWMQNYLHQQRVSTMLCKPYFHHIGLQ